MAAAVEVHEEGLDCGQHALIVQASRIRLRFAARAAGDGGGKLK